MCVPCGTVTPPSLVRHYPQLFGREAEDAIADGEHPDEAAEDMVEEAQGESQPPAATDPQQAASGG